MWTADSWKDYEILDVSGGEKLERWGVYRLIRPDPQVIWDTPRGGLWNHPDAHYHRSRSGGGQWEFFSLPQEWMISYTGKGRERHFMLKPFSFKHTGLFPEQAVNWDWFTPILQNAAREGRQIRVLNLFAYTGGATVAAAAAGAAVTHLDASRGMVTWARENAALCGLSDAPVRWLVDDCTRFAEREQRRGSRYDAIIMDPPSYGRGPKGEVWKMEDNIFGFLKLCSSLLSEDPLFVLVNSYTTGLQPAALSYMLNTVLTRRLGGRVEADEVGLPVTSSGLVLPCGAAARWTAAGPR